MKALFAAAFVVALVSCPRDGDEARLSKQAYEQKVKALYSEVQAAFRATRGLSGADLAGRIGDAQQALRRAGDELAAAKPPRDIEHENRELTEGMREYANALDAAHRSALSGNDAMLAPFQDASTNAGVRRMSEAAERMKYKGYDLGGLSGKGP